MDIIGGILLALCGVPEWFKTIKEGECRLSWGFLLMWFIGEVCLTVYTISTFDYWLLLNYGMNTLITGHLIKIKFDSIKFN